MLGHPYGFEEGSPEDKAYKIFKSQEGASSRTIGKQIQKLSSSDSREDQRTADALLKFHANKPFTKEEKEFLFDLTSDKLTKEQWNTPGTQGMALAMYLNTLDSDQERKDFLDRLAKRHVSYGIVSPKALEKANYFYDNEIFFNERESRFYSIYQSGGKRADAIVTYMIERDLSESEVKKQLNIYLKAGMMNEETVQGVISKLKEEGIAIRTPE